MQCFACHWDFLNMGKKTTSEALPTVKWALKRGISEACLVCVVLHFLDEDTMCNAADDL